METIKKKGKFNIIDLLVIVMVIAVGIVGYNYLAGSEDNQPTSVVNLEVSVELDFIKAEFKDTIQVGDTLIALNTSQSGQVISLEVLPYEEVQAIDGQLVPVEDPSYIRMIVGLEVQATKYGPYMDFSGNELKSGKLFRLETDAYGFEGKTIDVRVVD